MTCDIKDCCEGKCCSKKCCKIGFVVATVIISFVVSLGVVKAFAPCVVKDAMMKEFVAKQMDFAMMKGMMEHHKIMEKGAKHMHKHDMIK